MSYDQSLEEKNKVTSANHVKKVQMLYPDERLVALLSRKFKKMIPNRDRNALDIGFGSGRHVKLLLDFGFNTYGIEYTAEAVEVTRNILTKDDYANLVDLSLQDYRTFQPPVKFDVIVGWGLLMHSHYDNIAADLDTIARMLSENGRLYVNFRTTSNWFFGLGEKVSNHTYVLDARAKEYEGYTYSFVRDRASIQEILSRTSLKMTSVEQMDLWKNDLTQQHSWIICELEKTS